MEYYKPNYDQEFYNRILSYKNQKVSVYLRTNEKLIGTLNQVGISQNKPYIVLDVGEHLKV
jgi:hypothetical protein